MPITDLPIIRFDDETRSGYDLPSVGRHKYVKHADADLICMGWRLPTTNTKLWTPGLSIPEPFLHPSEYRFAAFNIQFDAHMQATIGRRYGFKPIPLENQIDIMAVACRLGLPQSLDKLGEALGVTMPKMKAGKDLKKIFCSPPYGKNLPLAEYNTLLNQFYAYCIRDVDSMNEIMTLLPIDHLPPSEQHIWQVNCEMNSLGLPIDHAAVHRIDQVCDYYRNSKLKDLEELTNGEVTKIGSTKKIIEWCAERGIKLDNLQAKTVEDTIESLEKQEISDQDSQDVLDILKLRQLIGGAAVKKYKRLDAMATDGRVYDNSKYHGAGTGRTTGGGFQYLNLPRATVIYNKERHTYAEAVEKAIQSFYDTTVLKQADPLYVAKALVRPMIKANDGMVLLDADWNSIEYILLMWYAQEWKKVEAFRKGEDPYIRFATKLYGVDYDDVTKQQRQESKPPVLGAGYLLSANGLVDYAKGYGVDMNYDQAYYAINMYKTDHPLVKDLWWSLQDCANRAVQYEGRTFATHNTSFRVVRMKKWKWLVLTLPSGRKLFYCNPKLADTKFGTVIKHLGVHSKIKKWTWVYLGKPRLIENIIQALGRDVLQHGYDRVLEGGFKPIGTIYDQIICENPEETAEERLQEMIDRMCILPPWAEGLPLKADGYFAKRFKK